MIPINTNNTPSTALAVAKQLVQVDNVTAVLVLTDFTSIFSHYLTSAGVPVVGAAKNEPEWLHSQNMFSPYGPSDGTKTASTFGVFLKSQGVTNLASVGYSILQAHEATRGWELSAKAAGIKIGYYNAELPLDTTDVEPVALQMKSAGVNGYAGAIGPQTQFSLLEDLNHLGVKFKGGIAPLEGQALIDAGPGAIAAAQGLSFFSVFESGSDAHSGHRALRARPQGSGRHDGTER